MTAPTLIFNNGPIPICYIVEETTLLFVIASQHDYATDQLARETVHTELENSCIPPKHFLLGDVRLRYLT